MVENALDRFPKYILISLTSEQKDAKGLVKKHSDNLQTHGDFSFPISVKSWQQFLACEHIPDKINTTLFEALGKEPEDIVKESKKWDLPVRNVKIENGRLYMFLERPRAIRVGLTEAIKNNLLLYQRISEKCSNVVLDPFCEDKSDITCLRTHYVCNVIHNICAVHKLQSKVFVTCKSTNKIDGYTVALCGTVLNAKSRNKETVLTAENFIRLRQNEMTLIAQHKYGVRVSTDPKWKEFIAHLGESAAAFELLQSKPSSPIKINFDNCAVGSSKGASFILYNCARLETIIRTYNDNASQGKYPELTNFDEVDFSLLSKEEEWCLIFNYILGLPSLLNTCIDVRGELYEFKPHHICSFLCSMVRVFSQYYRRIRILTEPRKHLLPVIFARIHMLTLLNDTLKICLKILNIKSVSQM